MNNKVKNTLKNIGVNFPIDYNVTNLVDILICDNIKKYKKGLKTSLNIYKNFKFDTLIFKIDFDYNHTEEENLENTINILNRFIDICKLKKPTFMKYTNYDNTIEGILFCWDLSKEKIKIKNLIKEILFLNNDGFIELFSSVFFLDTNKHILFNFYSDKIIKILYTNNKDLNKIYKKYKKIIITT